MGTKILGALLMPLTLVTLALLLALLTLLLGRRRLGVTFLSLAVALLLSTAWWPVADRLLRPLETAYPMLNSPPDPNIGWVMVLGAGHDSDPSVPITSQLSDTAVVRIVEGVRLFRQLPDARLVVSGWGDADPRPHAEVAAQLAIDLGVPAERIVRLDEPRNTAEEAIAAFGHIGEAPFYLVTSASHMPRAMALFREQGLTPIPAPTRHRATAKQGHGARDWVPRARDLAKSERAFHEYLGLLWGRLRGLL